jgi:hypothetical protein
MSIPAAAQCDTFVSFLESSSSFAELRLNLRLQVRYMLQLRGGGAVLRVLTRMQMTSLEIKTRETTEGSHPPPPSHFPPLAPHAIFSRRTRKRNGTRSSGGAASLRNHATFAMQLCFDRFSTPPQATEEMVKLQRQVRGSCCAFAHPPVFAVTQPQCKEMAMRLENKACSELCFLH